MNRKIKKLIEKIEGVGLLVKYDDSDKLNPHIEIYGNLKKQPICEIVFDKKGNIDSFVVSKRPLKACWIKLK